MRRIIKTLTAAALSLCLLPLSACNFIMTDAEGLLEKPTLNAQQAEVYRAMEETLNPGDIIYRRPQRGEYRSPFLFFDMDGDGAQEAIVFYSFVSDTQSTWTKILKENADGQWHSISDFAVISDQIDFVQFSNLLSETASCMLIGWQTPLSQSNRTAGAFLGVYSLADGVFTTEVDRQPYLDYSVQDFDGDGLDEVITVGRDGGQGYRISLLRSVGRHIDVTSSLPLSPEIDGILKITTGSLWGSASAVYIDELRTDASTATEVIQVDRTGLTVLAGGAAPVTLDSLDYSWENYTYTFRDETLLSQDIDADGKIEVPAASSTLPGNLNDWNEAPIRLTPYIVMTTSGFDVKCNAVVNDFEGYLLLYPDRWRDRVAVQQTDETDEWRFYVVDPDTGEPSIELLRILAYSAKEAEAANPDEIALGSRGSRHFTGYIPRTENEPTAITESELRELFLLPAG